ncbi:hypothetical protein H6503_06215 [Candidatus Woesearchaeota archaeon]|nr:hypothetical protein [Candidatus Woesearchaeota archaeon]
MMMDNRMHAKFLSITFIMLMVLLPVELSLSVSGFTQTWEPGSGPGGSFGSSYVKIVSISGQDDINKFRRRSDSTKITVQASLGDNITVTPNNLEVFFSGFALGKFQSCRQVSGQQSIYECDFTEGNDSGNIAAAIHTYEINLVNLTEVLTTTSTTVTVDNKAPVIASLSTSTTRTANPNLTATFTAIDYAHQLVTGIGLKSVELTAGGTSFYKYPANASSYYDYDIIQTVMTKTVPVSIGPDNKDYPICVSATDFFGQSTTDCRYVTFDSNAPQILASTFDVKDSAGNKPVWLSDDQISLKVEMDFQGQDLDTNSIYGNFSDLHIDGSQDNVKPSNCIDQGNYTYTCNFNINAKINETRSYAFTFYAADDLGNGADSTSTYQLKYDNVAPKATTLITPYYYNGNYYIGKDPLKLTVNLDETGIGINNSEVYFDLSEIGRGTVKADNCTPGWTCYWDSISANQNSIGSLNWLTTTQDINGTNYTYQLKAKQSTVRITSSSKDDLGNSGNSTNFNLSVDVYPPDIIYRNITAIPSSSEYLNYTVVGDLIFIQINVSDGSYVTMNVSTNDFIKKFSDEVNCLDNLDGIHTCEYYFGPIEEPGFYDGTINVEIKDLLNNSIKTSETIRVYQIENGTTNYWKGNIELCSPNPLDRQLVDKMSSDIYCQVSLESGSAIIYDLAAGPCVDKGASGKYVGNTQTTGQAIQNGSAIQTLGSYSWMGIPRDEPSLFLNLVTTTFDPHVDTINCECTVGVRSVVNDQIITKNYEEVNVSISIPLYNSPLGEVNETTYNKLEGIYEDWIEDDFWALIGKLNQFVTLSTEICNLYNTLNNVVTLLSNLSLILGGTAGGAKSSIVGQTVGGTIDGTSTKIATISGVYGQTSKTLFESLDKYCAFISCKLVLSPKWAEGIQDFISDYLKLVNSASFFTGSGWSSMFSDGSSGSAGKQSDTPQEKTEIAIANAENNGGSSEPTHTTTKAIKDLVGSTTGNDPIDTTRDLHRITGNPKESSPSANSVAIPESGSPGSKDKKEDKKEPDTSFLDSIGDSFQNTGVSGIKESYILSTAFLCIPGIIYNLQKYRSIQCDYGYCLLTSAESGLPSFLCDDNKAYAECRYFYGPLMQFIPFAQFLSDVQRLIANLMADPWLIIDTIFSFTCDSEIAAKWICDPTPAVCTGLSAMVKTCLFYDTFGLFTDVYEDVQKMSEDGWADKFSFDETGSCVNFEDGFKALKEGKNNKLSATSS